MVIRRSMLGLTAVLGIAATVGLSALQSTAAAAPAQVSRASAAASPPPLPTGPSQPGPKVLPDRRVVFALTAPQANQVMLNLQNDVGPSPAANTVPMTRGPDGVWSVTVGPLAPNWYGYGYVVDGVDIADPANRNTWLGSTSSWSFVFVPGPAADYMADRPHVPHGTWSTVRYFSHLTETERQMQVYTPPGYNHSIRAYPVLYLMHGGGGNDTDWIVNMRLNYIVDNLLAEHRIKPMIVAMPDGNVTSSFNINYSVPQDLFPKELVGSVIPYIEKTYRAAPGARNRAMAGLSLGGLWTLDTLLLHPGTFSYMGVFSSGWFATTRENLVQRHRRLLTNPAINKKTKLLWITVGDQRDIAYDNNFATLALFKRFHIKYKFVQGTGGHIWNTWRHDLLRFAPLLFR